MQRMILTSLIVFLGIFLSACSIRTDFIIINSSDDFIGIYYEIKDSSNWLEIPAFVSSEEFYNNNKKWREFSQDRYKIDNKKFVEVKLAPNEVLRIKNVDISSKKDELDKDLNIKILKINGKNGSITLEGNQVLEQFITKNPKRIFFSSHIQLEEINYK